MKAPAPLVLLASAALLGFAAPGAAQDRWQVTMHSDSVLWDLELLRLSGDTLVVRETDSERTLRLPVMQIDEVRLVEAAEMQATHPDPRGVAAGLMGTGDVVFRLTLRDRGERLEIIRALLAHQASER